MRLWILPAVCICLFMGCEAANYAPPVSSTMVKAGPRRQATELTRLERGRELFVHRCIECHTLPAMWKYSREDWPNVVNDMAHRASLKPSEREAVIAYILAVRATDR
jgi:nitrate/TMAO reductase-like tetraheme cytochrome c subunit